jgi:ribosomal-protein-alanine N-acetyltransferase
MAPNPGLFTIRPYLQADLDRLYEIDQICFPPTIAYSLTELRFYLSGRRATGRVAEISGRIAGFAVGRTGGHGVAYVITLDVLPEARRQGIGRALMEALHADFDRQGAKTAILEVSVENVEARRFYERLGYRFAGILPGYYNGETDAWRMVRSTTGPRGERALNDPLPGNRCGW